MTNWLLLLSNKGHSRVLLSLAKDAIIAHDREPIAVFLKMHLALFALTYGPEAEPPREMCLHVVLR